MNMQRVFYCIEIIMEMSAVLVKKQTKCYIYTRVSTSMQVDDYGLDAQR